MTSFRGRPLKAFTLVELIIVIAIIGILASLAVMSLGRAQSKSRDSRRKADVRTYEAAIEKFRLTDATVPALGVGGNFYGRMNFNGTQGNISYPVIATSPASTSIASFLLNKGLISTIARDPSAPANDTAESKPDYVLIRCKLSGAQELSNASEASFAIWTKLENDAKGSDVENTSRYCGYKAGTNYGYGGVTTVFPGTSVQIGFAKYYSAGSIKLP